MSLLYPTTVAKSFADQKALHFSYENMARLVADFIKEKDKTLGFDKAKLSQILLLGHAFKSEIKSEWQSLAERLYKTWLLGPDMNSFSVYQNKKDLSSNYGNGFYFDRKGPFPWMRLSWSEISSANSVKMLKSQLQHDVTALLSNAKNVPPGLLTTVRNEVKKGLPSRLSGKLGNYTANALNSPEILLPSTGDPDRAWKISTSVVDVMIREHPIFLLFSESSKGNFATKLLNAFASLKDFQVSDIAASVGSMNVYVYLRGDYSVSQDLKKATVSIKAFGYRLVDSYDFNNQDVLGCWYPNEGFGLLRTMLAYGMQKKLGMPPTYMECALTDQDFAEFRRSVKDEFNRFLEGKAHFRLRCEDFYLVTSMQEQLLDKIEFVVEL
jgi:hypothetical protein